MAKEITALIFDLDGTLIDTMPAHFKAWEEALAPYALDLDKSFYYSMAGWPTVKVAKAVLDHYGLHDDPELLAKRKEELFYLYSDSTKPIAATVAIAQKFAGRLPLAVATGSLRKQACLMMDKMEITKLFPIILTADDGLKPKPAPDIFLKAAELMGKKPENCLVFEDGDAGLKAAQDGGMLTIDVRTPPETWQPILDLICLK